MSLSIQKMVSDGTLSTIVLGVQYLQRNDVYLRIAGVETPQSGAPSGYTWSFVDNNTIRVLPVVPAGVEVVVYRRTDLDEMYNIYSQNAQFDESTIDENNQQLLYIAQEYFEQGVPAQLIDSAEYVREDTTNMYYRLKLSDGKYTAEFPIPKGGAAGFEALRRTYADAGSRLVDGSFETGGTLSSATDVLLFEVEGKAYSYTGTLPHTASSGSSPSAEPGIWLDKSVDSLRQQAALLSKVITLKIPDDYPDLPSALGACSRYHGSGNKITVLIKAGHALTKGYRFDNVDLSFVSIKSEDLVVPCSPSFVPVSTTDLDAGLGRSNANMFVSIGGCAPEWGITVSAAGLDMPIGYLLGQAARGKILPGCGVINVTFSAGDGIGIAVRTASQLDGYQAKATGCEVGIAVAKASSASIAESDTTGCTVTGVDVSRGSLVYMNDSTVGGTASTYGLYARRSWVAAQRCFYSGGQTRNINAGLGAKVIAADSMVTAGASVVGYVEQGGEIDLSGVTRAGVPITANDVFPKAVNVRTKQGVVSSQSLPNGTSETINSNTSAITVTAASAAINPLEYLQVLNLTGARTLHGGTIYGRDVGVRITVDGVVVLNDISRAQGKDSLGDDLSVAMLPHCDCESTLVVEVYNRASVAAQIGWKIYTRSSV